MYCSSCGKSVARALSYCNHCGAKLTGAKNDGDVKSSEAFRESLVWAIVVVFIVGVGCTIGLMTVMKEVVGFDLNVILVAASLIFLLMLALEVVMVRLLLRQRSDAKEADKSTRSDDDEIYEIRAARARELSEPGLSVTEDATRKFEPIYSDRKAE